MENIQKKLDAFLSEAALSGKCPRILLHACCAPCSSYVLEYLSTAAALTVLFYNPNMDTEEEYEKRAAELSRLVKEMGLSEKVSVRVLPYDHEDFEEIAKGYEDCPERGERCRRCYELRLRKTAQYMKEHGGYDYFATTLTLSPLKSAGVLNETGQRISEEYGVSYLPTDFKKKGGYQRSIELSKEYNLYRQDYCGCKYSKRGKENE